MKKRTLNNKGFTLIEILLSIAIFTILLLPVLNNFITAMKVNIRTQRDQKATTLAQNIMESLKTMDIEQTALQFNGINTFNVINSNLNGYTNSNYSLKNYASDGYGEYHLREDGSTFKLSLSSTPPSSIGLNEEVIPSKYVFRPPSDRDIYYFGIERISDNRTKFDVLVSLDADIYGDVTKYGTIMNNYEAPSIISLNRDKVAIIDMEGITTTWSDETLEAIPIQDISTDEQALSEFYNLYLTYLSSALSTLAEEIPPSPTPIPLSKDEIKNAIYKDIHITLSKNDELNQVTVTCNIRYRCELDLNNDGEKESLAPIELLTGTYPFSTDDVDSFIYLFYTPSMFTNRDTIRVQTNGVTSNIYLTNQKETEVSMLKIIKEGSEGDTTNIYTNINGGLINSNIPIHNKLIGKNESTDRIYNITVSIYEAGSIDKGNFLNPYVTFSSTKEE